MTMQKDHFVVDRLPPADQLPQWRYGAPELQFADQLNLVEELLDKAAIKGWAHRPLLRSPGLVLTYAEVRTQVDRIAKVLVEDCALVPGNRVLLRGGNSIDMALAWLAVAKAGLIAVATMPLLRAKELDEIIDKARPALALCDAKLAAELHAVPGAPPTILFNLDRDGESLAMHAARKSDSFAPCATSADDIALMAFTSGTTGKPKAVVHSHRDVLAACECWPRHILQATPDDIVMGSPPLAFTFGLGGLLLFPMWAGASVYFPDVPYTPDGMARIIHDTQATICYTAPTFYRQLAPHMKLLATERGVPALRICVSAGEGLPDATRQLWKDATGIEMLDGIGATEMFHIFVSSAGIDVRRGAIGKVVPGYIAHVVDDDGNELPRGQVGKLAVIGPTGCRYLDDTRQTNYVKDGWNYPGDAFMQDADGYFFYKARADDMIITAGYNVGGPEVEDALLKHPAVAECGVVGQPDDERGMIVKAFVVLKPGHLGDQVMVKALQEHVKATIAPFKYPRDIVFINALPRTETGKLQRFKLRSL